MCFLNDFVGAKNFSPLQQVLRRNPLQYPVVPADHLLRVNQ